MNQPSNTSVSLSPTTPSEFMDTVDRYQETGGALRFYTPANVNAVTEDDAHMAAMNEHLSKVVGGLAGDALLEQVAGAGGSIMTPRPHDSLDLRQRYQKSKGRGKALQSAIAYRADTSGDLMAHAKTVLVTENVKKTRENTDALEPAQVVVVKLQAAIRGFLGRKHHARRVRRRFKAAVLAQASVRRHIARRSVVCLRYELECAARIQAQARGKRARRTIVGIRHTVTRDAPALDNILARWGGAPINASRKYTKQENTRRKNMLDNILARWGGAPNLQENARSTPLNDCGATKGASLREKTAEVRDGDGFEDDSHSRIGAGGASCKLGKFDGIFADSPAAQPAGDGREEEFKGVGRGGGENEQEDEEKPPSRWGGGHGVSAGVAGEKTVNAGERKTGEMETGKTKAGVSVWATLPGGMQAATAHATEYVGFTGSSVVPVASRDEWWDDDGSLYDSDDSAYDEEATGTYKYHSTLHMAYESRTPGLNVEVETTLFRIHGQDWGLSVNNSFEGVSGVYVQKVDPGSPAAVACGTLKAHNPLSALARGSTILELDGVPIHSLHRVQAFFQNPRPTQVRIGLQRPRHSRQKSITMHARDKTRGAAKKASRCCWMYWVVLRDEHPILQIFFSKDLWLPRAVLSVRLFYGLCLDFMCNALFYAMSDFEFDALYEEEWTVDTLELVGAIIGVMCMSTVVGMIMEMPIDLLTAKTYNDVQKRHVLMLRDFLNSHPTGGVHKGNSTDDGAGWNGRRDAQGDESTRIVASASSNQTNTKRSAKRGHTKRDKWADVELLPEVRVELERLLRVETCILQQHAAGGIECSLCVDPFCESEWCEVSCSTKKKSRITLVAVSRTSTRDYSCMNEYAAWTCTLPEIHIARIPPHVLIPKL